jgi:hypothetical protein
MTPTPFVLAASLLAVQPVTAFQNEVATQTTEVAQSADEGDKPAPAVRTADGRRQAVERQQQPRAETRPAPAPAAIVVEARAEQPQPAAADDQRRNDGGRDRGGNPQTGGAAQRGDRPRGDNPPTGQATPRESRPAPARPQDNRRGGNGPRIYGAPPVYNYYYSPRRYYPYGYGAFGLGYFYYDPYTWYPPSVYGGAYGGYGGGYYDGYYNGYVDLGEVRLSVTPRSADVYVDGYFAGRVDDFDGVLQALKLESGAHHIQIVAPGYLPLDFDVRLNPGQKITYRGDLRR